jgi:hypothetical protein
MRSTVLVLLSFAAALPAATIDQFLNAPFASGLSAAPSGGKTNLAAQRRGRQKYLGLPLRPISKGRRLTSFKDDDGMEIGETAWSADGKVGDLRRGWRSRNQWRQSQSAQSPASSRTAIWLVPVRRWCARVSSPTDARPAVSKDGQVAFLRNGQIFLTNFAGDKTTEIVRTKGRSGDLRWSPDGTQLAFVSTRTDHSFIGVWRVSDKSVRYPRRECRP